MVVKMHLASMPSARPSPLAPEPETAHWITAFIIAFCLHVLLIWVLPRLEQTPLAATLRIEAQMAYSPAPSSPAPQSEPEPTQPKLSSPSPPEKPKPAKRPDSKPLLVAKEEAVTEEEFRVPETAVEEAPASVNPLIQEAVSTPATSSVASQSTIKESTNTNEAISNSTSVASTDSPEADAQEAWEGYGQLLHEMVSKNKSYPQIAVRRNWQGVAMVSARFVRGKLVEITLVQPSSGYKVLDNAAMEMLRKAVNAVPVRGDLARKSFTVIVPVDFKLEG